MERFVGIKKVIGFTFVGMLAIHFGGLANLVSPIFPEFVAESKCDEEQGCCTEGGAPTTGEDMEQALIQLLGRDFGQNQCDLSAYEGYLGAIMEEWMQNMVNTGSWAVDAFDNHGPWNESEKNANCSCHFFHYVDENNGGSTCSVMKEINLLARDAMEQEDVECDAIPFPGVELIEDCNDEYYGGDANYFNEETCPLIRDDHFILANEDEQIMYPPYDGFVDCVEDLDSDNIIGFGDLTIVLASWGGSTPCVRPDLNRDGSVGFEDLIMILSKWDQECGQ